MRRDDALTRFRAQSGGSRASQPRAAPRRLGHVTKWKAATRTPLARRRPRCTFVSSPENATAKEYTVRSRELYCTTSTSTVDSRWPYPVRVMATSDALLARLIPEPARACSSATDWPDASAILDCHIARSLSGTRGLSDAPKLKWQKAVRATLLGENVTNPLLASLSADAAATRSALARAFEDVRRWHITTQDRLIGHLRRLWDDNRSRVMVDLGCHAGHGRSRNLSDALVWLHYFNHSGRVVGVDALQDFALDVQLRLDREPYASLASVRKVALALAISTKDGEKIDLYNSVAKPMMLSCTSSIWAAAAWNQPTSDHYCRIVRSRLDLQQTSLPLPVSSYPPSLFAALLNSSAPRPRYEVATRRADTLWLEELGGATIDFLKVDIDRSWRDTGLEGLLEARGFSVMVIEVDLAWSWPHRAWGLTAADQLTWLARAHGYDSYLKVPCRARVKLRGHADAVSAAWYYPIANTTSPFVPAAVSTKAFPRPEIHDLLLVDSRQLGLGDRLRSLGASDCLPGAVYWG